MTNRKLHNYALLIGTKIDYLELLCVQIFTEFHFADLEGNNG